MLTVMEWLLLFWNVALTFALLATWAQIGRIALIVACCIEGAIKPKDPKS